MYNMPRTSARRPVVSYALVNPQGICRICLYEGDDIVGVEDCRGLTEDVHYFYKIKIVGNDTSRSSKLCKACIRRIQFWQGHISRASCNQRVVEYLANKKLVDVKVTSEDVNLASEDVKLPSEDVKLPSENVNKRPLFDPNTKRKTTSRRSKKRKSTPKNTKINTEIPSTSNGMIQSPLESIQQSTSASISQCQSIDNVSTEIIPIASTSAELIPYASTPAELIQYASTSAEVIPYASTSAELIQYASTPAELIQYASTSAELIPYATSSSLEIVQSYTVNEISSTGDNPVWYSNGNKTTDPESEVDDRNKSYTTEFVCIFCTYQHEEISRNAYNHILFCSKHFEPYACLVENCHSVFPNKSVFIQHYRTHLNLNNSTYLCHKCFSVLACSRRSVMSDHTHQNLSDLLKCCELTFTTMTKFVLHKLTNHSAIVVTSHNRWRTLQKQNLDIKKTELDDIKVGLDVPGTVPCNQKIKDNGKFLCYRCPKKFTNIPEFIDHSKIKHKNLITLKDKKIKLCPMCDNSYFNEHFTEHLENCTNTLLVGDKSLKHYGCVYCRVIFTNVSSREFRNHVLYCKSFKLGIVNNKIEHECLNCDFKTTDDALSLAHANSNCMFFQLKMRYAMGPNETYKVKQRMEFVKQNTEQLEDKDCTNDERTFSSSKTFCNKARQRLLKNYSFFCNNCKNLFFDLNIFCKHLTETGSYCRLQTLVYCQKCLTEFNTMEEYEGHLPSMPEASPIINPLLSIKQELLEQNNDDCRMSIHRINPNMDLNPNRAIKVEMNNETFYQKQEPFDKTSYGIGFIQEEELELQQEQEVSNNHYSNSVFSCPEVELPTNDIYMQFEVEEKVFKNPG